ncbi:MAG: hypothetical protein RMZ69_26330 [Nostoc sp. ChiQUE01a]|nr:hypothetical protein [Nostoc sp. ChiQUE01a]
MKLLQSTSMIILSIGLLFLAACNKTNQTNTPVTSTQNSENVSVSTSPKTKTNSQHGASKGGQVVETATYHLEFVPVKEAKETHMDLFLQKGDNHEVVSNAKVTAQVQLPDGKQKSVIFNYDAKEKHYASVLSEKATGQYQVKITADIQGEKVDGRFNFNR